jgi:adenylate cyclase
MRLNPYHPERFWNHLGRAYFTGRHYAQAIEALKKLSAPDHFQHAFLAACHAELGDQNQAKIHTAEVLKRQPNFAVSKYLATLPYKRPEDAAHHRDALLKAGLPA